MSEFINIILIMSEGKTEKVTTQKLTVRLLLTSIQPLTYWPLSQLTNLEAWPVFSHENELYLQNTNTFQKKKSWHVDVRIFN